MGMFNRAWTISIDKPPATLTVMGNDGDSENPSELWSSAFACVRSGVAMFTPGNAPALFDCYGKQMQPNEYILEELQKLYSAIPRAVGDSGCTSCNINLRDNEAEEALMLFSDAMFSVLHPWYE